MRYSQQQILDINRRNANIQQEIKNSNKRNKAIQDVIVDKQIEQDLLDRRNAGDIENDMFYRQSLLNDYSNELIKNGNVFQFQKLIVDEGYDEFFLNNFPKIKSESKMYRTLNPQTMFDLVKRLYNINQKEIDYVNEKESLINNNDDIKNLLAGIISNLNILINSSSAQQQQIFTDTINRLDALNQSLSSVDNQILFMQDVFGEAFPTIKTALTQLRSQTQIPSNPNVPIQTPPSIPIVQNITQNTLQQALNNQTTPQQKQNMKMKTDLLDYTDADYDLLKDMVSDPSIDRETYAQILVDLADNMINANQLGYNKGQTKLEMYKKFMKNINRITNALQLEQKQKAESERNLRESEENQRKRLEDDRKQVNENITKLKKETGIEKSQILQNIRKINNILKKLNDTTLKVNESLSQYQSRIREILREAKIEGVLRQNVDHRQSGDDMKANLILALTQSMDELNGRVAEVSAKLANIKKV